MRSLLLIATVALAGGCDQPPTVTTAVTVEHGNGQALSDERDVSLPVALAAKTRGFADEPVLFLNVTREGQVALTPSDVRPGAVGVFFTQDEALVYLQRRAVEERDTAAPAVQDKSARTVLLLRVDARSRFEHLHSLMTTARKAGYMKFRLRVLQPELTMEGEFDLVEPPRKEDVPPLRYTVRLAADDAGGTAKIRFSSDTPVAQPDHGTNLVALLDTLKAAVTAAERDRRATVLLIEVEPRLLHARLIQVIDVGIRAGFRAVWLVPVEPKMP
jgi:biopolymer transport protein ExbD